MNTKNRSFRVLFPLVVLIFISSVLFAGTTGKISGVVKDKETGEPLPGANVQIEGTTLGGATNAEGWYFILNVPIGTYEVRTSIIGYKAISMIGVVVTIDHTTTLDFAMEQTVIPGEEVTIIAERPLIQIDNTATRSFISDDDVISIPIESFTELVSLEAGAVGANIRGGRASGTVFFVDGISLRNPTTGYGGQGGGDYRGPSADVSLAVDLPEFSFEEIEMLTGGYSPEFGNAQDAVINIATKEGGLKHTGRVRVTTEGKALTDWNGVDTKIWYIDPSLVLPPDYLIDTDGDDIGDSLVAKGGRLIMGGQEMDADDIEDIHKNSVLGYVKGREEYIDSTPIWEETRGAYERNKYSFNMAGPVPILGKATYSISGENVTQAREQRQREDFNFLGKLTYQLSSNTKLNLSTLYSTKERSIYDYFTAKYRGGYLPGYGPLYSQLDMLPSRFKADILLSGVLTQTLSPRSYVTITAGVYTSDYEQKQKDYDDRDGDGDRDEYLVYKWIAVPSGNPDSADYSETYAWRYTTEGDEGLQYIWTQDPTRTDTTSANYDSTYQGEWRIGNSNNLANSHLWSTSNPTGWREIWTPTPDGDEWIWSSEWLFVNGENEFEETGVKHQGLDEKIFGVTDAYWSAWGDEYGYQKFKSKVTTLKVDYANQINSVHFLQTGGEFSMYDLDIFNIRAYSVSNFYLDEWKRTPTEWALYFRDKIEMGGLIVNAGFRLDSYNLGDDVVFSADADDPLSTPVDPETDEIVNPVDWKDEVGVKIYFSPRLGIAHPITDRDVLHFSYNHFLQRPDWRYFYENLSYSIEGAYEEIGNPKIEPQRTVSYEVGFTHQFTPNLKVDATAFYKDIFGWTQQMKGGDIPATHFWIYGNADFGSVKGFELSLDKRYSNYFSADVNYTYMTASGRLSDPQLGGTYLWRQLVQPRKVHLLDYDQRHTLNISLGIYLPPSRNPLFGDWRINITERYGSGLPFDSQSRSVALTVPPENDKRRPFTNNVDLRVAKRLGFKSAGVSVFLEVFNLLDRDNLGVDPRNAEWYLSEEDLDGNGVTDHYLDPEGRRHDWTVWQASRRAKVGIEVEW